MKYLNLLCSGLVGLLLSASIATAEPLTIYAGGKGGGYDTAAVSIAARLNQRGIDAVVENRGGSDDITLQACRNPNSVWIAQIDALYTREFKDGCFLPVIAEYGDEVAVLMFAPGEKANELSDLNASHTVFVDKIGSGSELTWRTMVAIEKEHGKSNAWIEASLETSDLRRATALAGRGLVHAALLVRKPNSPDITRLLDQGWDLGELYDKDINDLKFGAKPLYKATKIKIGKNRGDGYVVPSFIGTTEAIERDSPDVFDALLGALE
ncbi:hypothetical protein [Pacificibacter marinus]|uniref:hypothetical protein n=1 Tax=Pacificibacter marinus TaxID=658057 RepID=UPI001C06D627|nr:hypothetical protein [Pacificibacter marinus]MBU2867031.1 hypothetical protein [Pacificibacter marinus]